MKRINRQYSVILFLLCLTGKALFSADPSAAETVVINEFMADNASTVADQYEEYDDWIELYNNSAGAISLSGYYLTDSDDLTQWSFPAGASIAAGGYLIIWADKDEDQTEGLHADFKLSADGESISLVDPDGETVIDQVTYGAQKEDISMGRYPNGTGDFVKMNPSYLAENTAGISGDVDGDAVADLSDAIMTLHILCGITSAASAQLKADVNNDEMIGIEECLFILRGLAGIQTADGNDSEITLIQLSGDSITVKGDGATAAGSTVTITSAGTYSISGTLTNGQIVVDTEDQETVSLILNGINVTNSTNAPLYIAGAEETVITLADNTENYLTDGASYVFDDPEEDEPNAALFSKDNLSIEGSGSLNVTAKYNDGIASKDDLTISGGVITVTAADDGIRGKDRLIVKGGSITVNAGGDGFKSDNDDDEDKGYVSIEAGTVIITSGGDAVQAETNVTVADGSITLTSGGGSSASVADGDSAKGIKGSTGVAVSGGTLTVNSADDAVHSNGSIVISGGAFAISSGDDGIHADTSLTIGGGEIDITKCYEGIESELITINDGEIHIVSSDDAVNAAGGADSSGIGGWPGDLPSGGDYWLYINGGYIAAEAAGDGIDVNGSVEMSAGTVIVNGPTANDNGALDYDGSFRITGGFLVAAGSSGMAQAPGTTSTQNSLLLNISSAKSAGTLIHIQTGSSGILTFAPSKTYQSVAFSSPDLVTGSSYAVYFGGSSTGTVTDGLYQNGTYTPGTQYTSFTVSGTVTTAGSSGTVGGVDFNNPGGNTNPF